MKTISIYQVEDTPIGSGGMGRVLRGSDPQGRQVAIKEILPEFASDFEIRTRTEREVELLQQLNNDSIVKVYDQFPLGDNFYIVMELVDGLNIEQYIQKYGAIPYERATRFMVKILEAMQFVHEKNFVHRDMKPSNIMIRNDERICILDFGIAKDMGNQVGGGTLIGTIIGSDGYMSPEQADGFSIDHRADIYALGCVFYYMLTGHHAYDTLSTDFDTRNNIANTPFPKLSKHSKKSFPDKLQAILDNATDRNMMKRYQSCREFRKDLEDLLTGGKGSHTVISTSKSDNIFITVGREGCDIIVNDNSCKVSRSHLDITFRQFTGGRYYVITDHSSNGTSVNGQRLVRGESKNISVEEPAPQVLLACDANLLLDWDEVKRLIAVKLQKKIVNDDNPVGETQVNLQTNHFAPSNDGDEISDITFIDAIKMFFTRAFDFNSRSRRKEYWYVFLFNIIVSVIIYLLSFLLAATMFNNAEDAYLALSAIYSIVCIVPGLSLTIRRLHDIGKDWKTILWLIAAIIPIVNLVILVLWIVWMTKDSDPTENEWGPCPK